MSLRDGTKKMSKSDPSDYSRINLTDDADAIAEEDAQGEDRPGARCRPRRRGPRGPARGGQPRRHLRGALRTSREAVLAEHGGAAVLRLQAGCSPSSRWTKLAPIAGEMRRLLADTTHISTPSSGAMAANGPGRGPKKPWATFATSSGFVR
jgi:tryptophanyl-tRNA synthetase